MKTNVTLVLAAALISCVISMLAISIEQPIQFRAFAGSTVTTRAFADSSSGVLHSRQVYEPRVARQKCIAYMEADVDDDELWEIA